ncbi:MAG: hypothetical protein ACE5FY_01515 [Nitrospiria bacterium]
MKPAVYFFIFGFFLAFITGCGTIDPGEGGIVGSLDHDFFKTTVQPVLDNRRCSDSGCHFRDKADPNTGGPGGSFRLFECKVVSCTPEELLANHDSSAGMANLVNPGDSKILKKPLALSIGGFQHLGGDIFLSETGTDYLAIFAWIQSPI